MDFLYGSVPDTLSQLIRTAFVARKGYTFIVSDFSSIEARVLAYIAREKWRIDSFAANKDIYAQSAQRMFSKPVVKGGINSDLRQKGKIAELALGYGGGEGALMAMGALDMGLTKEELPNLVKSWRHANPHIASYWWQVDRAVREAIEQLRITRVGGPYLLHEKRHPLHRPPLRTPTCLSRRCPERKRLRKNSYNLYGP